MKKYSQQSLESIYAEVLVGATDENTCVLCWKENDVCGCGTQGYLENDPFLNLTEVTEFV